MNDPKQDHPQQAPEKQVGRRSISRTIGLLRHEQQNACTKKNREHAPHRPFKKHHRHPPDVEVPSGGAAIIGGIEVGFEESKPGNVHEQDAEKGNTPDDIHGIDAFCFHRGL